MRISKIVEALANGGPGTVVADETSQKNKVILWTHPSIIQDNKTRQELIHYFPCLILAERGLLLKLGSFASLAAANKILVIAREKVSSLDIQKLFLLSTKKNSPPKPKPFSMVRESKRRVIEV